MASGMPLRDHEYVVKIAQEAAKGIVGEGVTRPELLEASILDALVAIIEAAERRGLDAQMLQLSMIPGNSIAL